MTPDKRQHSIGRKKAIKLFESGWYKKLSSKEIVLFQLFVKELSIPFSVFHKELEKQIKRPIFTHELVMNLGGIMDDFLGGKPDPTFKEIKKICE